MERLTCEYDLTEGEDKITLLSMFEENQLEDVRTSSTVWLTSMAILVNKEHQGSTRKQGTSRICEQLT